MKPTGWSWWIALGVLLVSTSSSNTANADPSVARVAAFDRGRELQLALELRARDHDREPPASRTIGIVLAGASALSLSGFTFFGVSGLNEKDRLLDTCAAACSDAEVATVRNRYLAADALLAVGVVTGAAAIWLLLRND